MKRTLIVPCVTNNTNPIFEYSNSIINCVNAIRNIRLSEFDEIYFAVLKHINEAYNIKDKILTDMKLVKYYNKVDVLILDEITDSPADTVMHMLNIIGSNNRSIFIKDADNSFTDIDVPLGNNVMISSLEETELVDPIHKSYVSLDEQGFITNAIERHVISDKFIAGGYSFENANDFKEAYNALKQLCDIFYISDIIFWLILNKNIKFLPINAYLFNDFNL